MAAVFFLTFPFGPGCRVSLSPYVPRGVSTPNMCLWNNPRSAVWIQASDTWNTLVVYQLCPITSIGSFLSLVLVEIFFPVYPII